MWHHHTLTALVLSLAILAFTSVESAAIPITYEMDFTVQAKGTNNPNPLPDWGHMLPATFTYDASTASFSDFYLRWSISGRPGGDPTPPFILVSFVTDAFGIGIDINRWAVAQREMFFQGLLAGGTWSAGTSTVPVDFDSAFTLNSVTVYRLWAGNGFGDHAYGTFTTTAPTFDVSDHPSAWVTATAGFVWFTVIWLGHRRLRNSSTL